MNIKNVVISIALLLISTYVSAQSYIVQLKVVGDVVYFATGEAKEIASPSCMLNANSVMWFMSLSTVTGKASYALLVSALSNNAVVTITSANDCADQAGFERAASLKVEATPTSASSLPSKQLYLVKSDGVTPVGRIIEAVALDQFWYIPSNTPPSASLTLYKQAPDANGLYFTNAYCGGTPYTTSSNITGKNKAYSNTSFFKSSNVVSVTYYNSLLYGTGECKASYRERSMYEVDFSYQDPLCGNEHCLIKDL